MRRALATSRFAWFHSSVHCRSQVEPHHGSLTLSSIGLHSETAAASNKPNKPLGSTSESLKNKGKPFGSNEREPVRVIEKQQQIEPAPFAAKSFSELGLPNVLVERLKNEGFAVPTEVQCAAVPTILKNHDVIIESWKGSGKTLAYLLPILSAIGPLRNKFPQGDGDGGEPAKKLGIEALIVAPSREIGMQIVMELEKILGSDNKRVVQQLVGSGNRSRQEEALRKNKPAIVVGTPSRIAELSAARKLRTLGCRFLVLDEVDVLLSSNLRKDMHRMLEHVGRRSDAGADPNSNAERAEHQLIMVSATVSSSVVSAARSWGCDPLLVRDNKVVPLETVTPAEPVKLAISSASSSPNSSMPSQAAVESLPPALKHYYCVVRLQHKVDTLRRCIYALHAKYVIAFMNHTKQLKDVVCKLEARGMKAAELHGDLGELARSTILKKFKNGDVRVLVTTELSARGLDVAKCDLVVNLELPTDSIHYAHRAGRIGRLGRNGTVLTICKDPEVFVLKKLQKQLGIPIPCCDIAERKLVVTAEDKALSTP